MDLSVIIPAYNEENRIGKTIETISEYLETKKSDYEILVVNDGSQDNTQKCVESIGKDRVRCITLPHNYGKGYAVKCGIENAAGDVKIYTDADMPFDINALKYSIQLIRDGAEVVCGKRFFMPDYPSYRKIMSGTFGFAVRALGLARSDTQCGFKAFSREAADKIFRLITRNGFSFDVEVMLIAEKMKLDIYTLPLLTQYKGKSSVKPVRDSMRMIGELTDIYKNNMHGIYGD